MKRQRTVSDNNEEKGPKERALPSIFMPDVEVQFNKAFSYTMQEDEKWSFQVEGLFQHKVWQDAELLLIKSRLNAVKSELSDKDIKTWHSHTSNMNPAGLIVHKTRSVAKAEVCTGAWCKLHEILATFQLVESIVGDLQSTLRSLHLCEAPGAFIASLNHYIWSRKFQVDWEWTANTLNPHYEGNATDHMISDDHLILKTWPHWYFGPDNTGDITQTGNIKKLQEMHKSAKFHLVTADGSIDCADSPSDQEVMTSDLHFCELVTALSVLEVKGHLVLKMFTLLENKAMCMVYLMCCLFEQVTVFKPVTSKPGNSEVYLVCRGFQGVSETLLQVLLSHTDSSDMSIFPESSVPESFRKQHRSCCQKFSDWQIGTIRQNQDSFCDKDKLKISPEEKSTIHAEDLRKKKEYFAEIFVEKCQLQTIPPSHKLLCNLKKQIQVTLEPFHKRRILEGSLSHRQEVKGLPWQQRVMHMQPFEVESKSEPYSLLSSCPSRNCTNWTILCGRRLEYVKCSKFASDHLVTLYNTFMQHHHQKIMKKETVDKSLIESILACKEGLTSCHLLADISPFLEEFKHCLEEKGVSVTLNTDTECTADSLRLHLVSMPPDVEETNILTDQRLFGKCLGVLLQDSRRSDDMLLQMALPLTRLYAGLMYTLHLLYAKVCVLPTSQQSGIPCVDIFCQGFLFDTSLSEVLVNNNTALETSTVNKSETVTNTEESSTETEAHFRPVWKNIPKKQRKLGELIGCLNGVYNQWKSCEQEEGSTMQVLEFVPMILMYEDEFHENIHEMNDNCLMLTLNALIKEHQECINKL